MPAIKQSFEFSRLGNWAKLKVVEEQRTPRFVIPLLFTFLAVVASVWIPFYPLWMALIIAAIVGIISFRFPYLALVVLSVFVCSAAAYQTPEFGLFMLLFFMVLLIMSLFEWKLGYIVFLTIALSRFGLSLVVPVVSAMALSLFLSLAVVVVSGIFLTFLVTCGNLTVAGMFVGPVHQSSFMAFYRPAAEAFTPSNIGTALFGMDGADLDIIGRVMGDNLGTSIVPILEIIVWGLAVYLVYRYFHRTASETKHPVKIAAIPSGIIAGSFFCAYAILLTPGTGGVLAGVLLFGIIFVAILIGRVGKLFFATYISTLDVDVGIGTRISEMENLGESSFELVGGLADVKEDLRESIVVPLLMSDVAKKYGIDPPKGILLFGPPGCGKTLLMKALANELHVEMVTVKCSDIMSKWYGESEGKVAELFRIAKERRPCIIFFDDLEAMAKHRDMYSGDDVTPRLLSIILAEMDGMDQSAGIILVGTTNKPELIDPALLRPGRFDKIIYVPPPDVKERVEILKVHLAGRPMDKNIDMTTIAVKCDRFSGADLANLAREAATIAMRRALDTKQHTTITMSDLKTVAVTVKPSITLAMLDNYEMLKLDFERKMHHVKRADHGWMVSWDDVGGADRVKKDIKDYIELLIEEPDVLENFRLKTGRGMLLFGPPGCGKKHIMRAAANNLDIPIQEINSTELVGTRSQFMPSVKDIFRRAREATPSIVLISDIDVIGARDSIEGPDASKAIAQILMEIDNVSAKEHILVIATTNRPHTLHPSLLRPGRFDKMFYVPLPDKDARKKIFEIYLKNIPRAKDVDSALLEKLADSTDAYSAADIAAIVDEAKLMTVINFKSGELRAVTKKELVSAVERVESSITPEDLESSHAFMKTYKVRK